MFRVKIDYFENGLILTRSDNLIVESVVYNLQHTHGPCVDLVDLEGNNIRYGPYYHGKAKVSVFCTDGFVGSYQL